MGCGRPATPAATTDQAPPEAPSNILHATGNGPCSWQVRHDEAWRTGLSLAAKNAILIVEFAVELHHSGKSLYDSAVEAAKLRFRPIVMTSFAFILGVVPLAIATGANLR